MFRRSCIISLLLSSLSVTAQEITSELMDIISLSMSLSTASFFVQDSSVELYKQRLNLNRLEIFQDGSGFTSVSSNLVAKHQGICYGVFRGTFLNPFDWLQNADVFPHNVNGCFVHGGLDDNYIKTEKELFDQSLLNCLNSCGGEDECPLVFTGISQGGGTVSKLHIVLGTHPFCFPLPV